MLSVNFWNLAPEKTEAIWNLFTRMCIINVFETTNIDIFSVEIEN